MITTVVNQYQKGMAPVGGVKSSTVRLDPNEVLRLYTSQTAMGQRCGIARQNVNRMFRNGGEILADKCYRIGMHVIIDMAGIGYAAVMFEARPDVWKARFHPDLPYSLGVSVPDAIVKAAIHCLRTLEPVRDRRTQKVIGAHQFGLKREPV